jgi:hypothetical protein
MGKSTETPARRARERREIFRGSGPSLFLAVRALWYSSTGFIGKASPGGLGDRDPKGFIPIWRHVRQIGEETRQERVSTCQNTQHKP